MKKTLLQFSAVLVFLLTIGTVFGQDTLPKQSAFYDAKFIYEKCFNQQTKKFNNRAGLYAVLSKYYKGGIDLDTLRQNPFYGNYVPISFAQSGGTNNYTSSGMSPSFLGGMDVTKVANALANIMISHAKQELTIAFFNRFKKFSDENPEFRILFPKTTSNLQMLLSYKYTEMLPALRNGFFEDINNITLHLDDVMLLPKYRPLLQKFPEVRIAVNSLRLAQELTSGDINAADAISQFALMEDWDSFSQPEIKNMGNALELAALFSESLRETSGTVWVTPATASSLFKDDAALNIYLGLLYQQCVMNNIQFVTEGKTVLFADIMKQYAPTIELFHNKITEFVTLAHNLQDAKDNNNSYDYINASIDVVDYLFGLAGLFDEKIDGGAYLDIARNANSIFKDINNKQYNQAVTDAFNLLTDVSNLLGSQQAESDFSNFIEGARPYALFMANVINAKSEDEIEAALESVILPVGSSYVKKYSKFNFAVQSYLGARYSTGSSKTISGAWGDDFGVSAPIGLAVSWGFKKAGAITLFAPLIDLGAIVDYKLDTETTTNPDGSTSTTGNKDYKIELGQLFSPGAYIVYGLPYNIPLSLGFGGQYGPGLSKVSDSAVDVNNNPYWRWSIFLSVDIPLFNLRNTPRNDQ